MKENLNRALSMDEDLLYSWPKYSGKGEKTDLSKEPSNQKQFLLFSITVV